MGLTFTNLTCEFSFANSVITSFICLHWRAHGAWKCTTVRALKLIQKRRQGILFNTTKTPAPTTVTHFFSCITGQSTLLVFKKYSLSLGHLIANWKKKQSKNKQRQQNKLEVINISTGTLKKNIPNSFHAKYAWCTCFQACIIYEAPP